VTMDQGTFGKPPANSWNWLEPEFFILLVVHTSCRLESLVTHCGVYSNGRRGKLNHENCKELLVQVLVFAAVSIWDSSTP
jgi:hypothetical protein